MKLRLKAFHTASQLLGTPHNLAVRRSIRGEIWPPEHGVVESRESSGQMSCVSATREGPNGRTVNGLLYKYSTREVSIVCVCHDSLFSPAEFVKHAGCVDVSHPLMHITLIMSS